MVERDRTERANIKVTSQGQKNGKRFKVVISEPGGSSTQHWVTLEQSDYLRLSGEKASPEELVKESFRFLLEREPKESILSEFALPTISRYFPQYEDEIQKRLQDRP